MIETLTLKGMIRKTKAFRFSKTLTDNVFGLFFQILDGNAARNLVAWPDHQVGSATPLPDGFPGHATGAGEPSSRQASSSGDNDAAALDMIVCPEGTRSLTESPAPALAAAVA